MSRVRELLPLLARLAKPGGEPTTLAQLAVDAGKSPYYLQRLFKRELGESPKQYSQRVRLQQASAALLVTDQSVIDIAFTVGFDSHEGFTRAFKRHFGESPSTFRASRRPMFERLAAANQAHSASVAASAPCVTLYRISDRTTNGGTTTMDYTMTVKSVDEIPFLYARRQTEMDEMAAVLGEVFPHMFQMCMEKGLPLAGHPITRYPSFGPGMITFEAGMPLSGTVEELKVADTGDYEVGALHAGRVVSTIHTGPYDQLGNAYAALQRWIGENDETPAGAPWEVYLSDPAEVPNPEEWQTEVFHPLQ